VGHRRTRQGIAVSVLGTGLALTPLTTASAKRHMPSQHTSTARVCAEVRAEQQSTSSVGLSVERAIKSGNFAAAKQAMLSAYNADLNSVAKANGVMKQAPAAVQAAFNDLLTFVEQIKTDIQNANSEQQLVASFETLGKNAKLATDGTTITSWFSSKCGGSTGTTSSSSIP
jgi:hypothetical protein